MPKLTSKVLLLGPGTDPSDGGKAQAPMACNVLIHWQSQQFFEAGLQGRLDADSKGVVFPCQWWCWLLHKYAYNKSWSGCYCFIRCIESTWRQQDFTNVTILVTMYSSSPQALAACLAQSEVSFSQSYMFD